MSTELKLALNKAICVICGSGFSASIQRSRKMQEPQITQIVSVGGCKIESDTHKDFSVEGDLPCSVGLGQIITED